MNHKIIYCGNCGKKGHVYKNCYKPIISLGMICAQYDGFDLSEIVNLNKKNGKIFNRYKINEILTDTVFMKKIKSNLKFLMVCRKHTLGYIELIRGKYNIDNYEDVEYIKNIFKLMTQREIDLIKQKDFDLLWNDLWFFDGKTHKKEYDISFNKFNILLKGLSINKDNKNNINNYDLDFFLNFIDHNIIWKEPDWEFPKGRRNIKEEDLPCAIREFEEETNFSKKDYKVLDINPISEIFMGNNGINYKYTYYFAQCFNNQSPKINTDNKFQVAEISDIKWLSYQDAINKIRFYNEERKNVLNKVFNLFYFHLYHFLNNRYK